MGRLRGRISVRAVYDPVAERAAQAAADLRVPAFAGVVALGERAACDAFLLLDTGWAGIETLRLVARCRKPIYLSGSLGSNPARIRALHAQVRSEGLTLMPEFSRRYTPATSRLHELMATKLGRPRRIVVDAVAPRADDPCLVPGQGPGIDFLTGLFDWCRYVVRTRPLRLLPGLPAEGAGGAENHSLRLEFARPRAGGEGCLVELRLRGAPRGEAPESALVQHVLCERGEARLLGSDEIVWRGDESERHESLAAERSEVEVMLDHFCRRVVGGLVPIPDVEDVCRAVEIACAVEECLREGREVPLSADGRAKES
ncbi:MAG: hypothetical protein WED34_03790 [Planctomycetales bacterium]